MYNCHDRPRTDDGGDHVRGTDGVDGYSINFFSVHAAQTLEKQDPWLEHMLRAPAKPRDTVDSCGNRGA